MDLSEEVITPQKAKRYLNENKINRKLRDGVVEKYAADMASGKWTTCPVPISFYESGDIADGQHRLWAIVEAGTPIRFAIARGLTRADGLNIDTGVPRNLVDAARISGDDPNLSTQLLSYARGIEEGEKARKAFTNSQRLEVVQKHRDAADWVMRNGPSGRSIRNSAVMAAIGRAWYYEHDLDRLKRFCEVLQSGMSVAEYEHTAIALRNYLIAMKNVTADWRDVFLKTQNAISYFMRSRKLTVIKSVKDEAYPLPKQKKK